MDTNYNTTSRRNFLGTAGVFAATAFLMPKNLFAQTGGGPVETIIKAAATAKINVSKLRGNVYMLEGSGGNIAVLNGPDGKLLVDAGINVSKPNVLAALNSISSQPVKFLINSHWHFDHTSGNEWLHQQGAKIIAQSRTRDHLATSVHQEDWNYTFPPLPAGGLPTVLFQSEYHQHFNGEKIQVKAYKPAHTDADCSIYFPDADVLHVADTFWNSYYPMIDYSTGGSIDGMIAAAALNVTKASEHTIVIPGHGTIGNKADLITFHEMLVTIRERVAKLKNSGMNLEQVIAAKPTNSFDQKWGGFVIQPAFFTKLVYKGV